MTTFRRLLGFLRPLAHRVIVSGLLAAVAMGMTVLIPWLTGQAIDQVRQGDEAELHGARRSPSSAPASRAWR